jgi:hypothetical protein
MYEVLKVYEQRYIFRCVEQVSPDATQESLRRRRSGRHSQVLPGSGYNSGQNEGFLARTCSFGKEACLFECEVR